MDSNGGNEDTAVGSKRKAAGKTVKPSKKSASVPKNPVSAWNHYVSAIRPTVNTDQVCARRRHVQRLMCR